MRVALFLQRDSPAWTAPSTEISLGLNLKGLLGIRRHDQRAGHDHGGADVQLRDLLKVCELRAEDDLHLRKIRAVGEVDEAEILAGAQVADPAADLYGLAVKAFRVFE